jgi:hypothetical protein
MHPDKGLVIEFLQNIVAYVIHIIFIELDVNSWPEL